MVYKTEKPLFHMFQELHNIALEREKKENRFSSEKDLQCLCGCIAAEKSDAEEHEFDIGRKVDLDFVYIKREKNKSFFSICPACDPKRGCSMCFQTGNKYFNNTYFYRNENGQNIESSREEVIPNSCACNDIHKVVDFLNNAEIPEKYLYARFDSFLYKNLNFEQKKKIESHIITVEGFCYNLGKELISNNVSTTENSKYFMTLFGHVGTGKTLLAIAALKHFISKFKLPGKFIDFQYLLSLLKTHFDNQNSGESFLDDYRKCDFLVIDEFGKGRLDKEWPLEKLDDLINYRYNNKKITLLTTNYLPFDLKYTEKEKVKGNHSSTYFTESPINESFWDKSLLERIGSRMYERLIEVSEFVDFMGLPSYRRALAQDFLQAYAKKLRSTDS